MAIFKVEIQEFLSTLIEVEAQTEDEAILKVRQMYKKEEIVLDSNHYVATEINIFSTKAVEEKPFI
jgi:hypothetical protein